MICKNVSECKKCSFRSQYKLEFCDYLLKPIQVAQRECNIDPCAITVLQMKNYQALKKERKLDRASESRRCKCGSCRLRDMKKKDWCTFYNKHIKSALGACTVNPQKITKKQLQMFLKKTEKYEHAINHSG